jgi:Flp pilus assembly protein TadD
MKGVIVGASMLLISGLSIGELHAQDDETRQATGLPIMIGENVARGTRMNVSGQIKLDSPEKPARRPVIVIQVLVNGAVADRTVANDTGHYLFRNIPRQNVSIIVEVDGMEVARQPVITAAMGNPRLDFVVPWARPGANSAPPSVLATDSYYKRTPKNEELYRKALTASRGNDAEGAVQFLNQVLESDPKDHVAWTELGTIFFKMNSLADAEACYFKAIELKRDFYHALLNLGKLYITKKDGVNAALVLSNAVAAKPSAAEAHNLLGEAYLLQKKGSSAAHHFNEALKIAPGEMADTHLRLAMLYDAAGARNKASAEYKAFLGKRPEYPERKQLEKYIADNP